jgi:large subunit ribosomal protein L25
MAQVSLSASTSRTTGSRASRRLRSAGSIPGVVYGEGTAPLSVAVDAKEFRTAVSGAQGLNTLITLTADGTSYTVMAREIQRHPVRGSVNHIDFQVIDPNKSVTVEVPVHLVGDAVEVRHADFEVDQQLFTLHVTARPNEIPTHIDVDVSELRPGSSIRVGDIVLPGAVTAADAADSTIVTTRQGRVVVEATPEEEAAAAAVPGAGAEAEATEPAGD